MNVYCKIQCFPAPHCIEREPHKVILEFWYCVPCSTVFIMKLPGAEMNIKLYLWTWINQKIIYECICNDKFNEYYDEWTNIFNKYSNVFDYSNIFYPLMCIVWKNISHICKAQLTNGNNLYVRVSLRSDIKCQSRIGPSVRGNTGSSIGDRE